MAKHSLSRTHPTTSKFDLFHLIAILSAMCLTKHSQPNSPSTETTLVVKEAWRIFTASQYLVFISSLTDGNKVLYLCKYDGASLPTTHQTRLPFQAAIPMLK